MTDAQDAAARHGHLVGLKLRALVRDHLADGSVGEATPFAPGAALLHGGEAWVYLDDGPGRRLGASLLWSTRSGAGRLHVIAETDTGALARRAESFRTPITIWHASGRSLLEAVATPLPDTVPVPAHHLALRALVVEGGADPVEEHGVLTGEVRGLEVCRVVDDPDTGAARLEVGVGAHDREAFQMLHGDVPTVASLARIVDAVARHRAVGAAPHPLNRIAAERFIRWRLEREPGLVGATSITASPPPVPRTNLKDVTPCVATGTDASGRRLVVVCSSGVDLDLIPYATDARLAAGAGEEAVATLVVTPGRDRVRATGEIAGLLRHPVGLVPVD